MCLGGPPEGGITIYKQLLTIAPCEAGTNYTYKRNPLTVYSYR